MHSIGVISDTHGFVHPAIYKHFADCDTIWHAGDMGSLDVPFELKAFKPLIGVHGNIDGFDIRGEYPKLQIFYCEDVKVMITHIGGYPGKYEPTIKKLFEIEKPDLFVCGHSHILKVMYDPIYQLLHINPGAAGKSGFHNVITFVKFEIDKNDITNLQVIELPKFETLS